MATSEDRRRVEARQFSRDVIKDRYGNLWVPSYHDPLMYVCLVMCGIDDELPDCTIEDLARQFGPIYRATIWTPVGGG